MASKEYLQQRIKSTQEKITKKQGTLSKKQSLIAKKTSRLLTQYNIPTLDGIDRYNNPYWKTPEERQDIYWAMYDIGTLREDTERLQRDISSLTDTLQSYQEDLQRIIEKENSRSVQVLIDFLEDWKAACLQYFLSQKEKYDVALIEYLSCNKKFNEWWIQNARSLSTDERKLRRDEDIQRRREFNAKWQHVTQFIRRGLPFSETLEKALEEEKNRKYDDIIERVNGLVGQITDASLLTCNQKGNLDGIIVGTRGRVRVHTIGAGGYNIQCYHFRTLIRKL